MIDHLFSVTLLHNISIIHKYNLICHISGKCHLMCNDDHGRLLISKTTNYTKHFSGKLRIQRRCRLIKAQDIDTQEELLRNLRACGFDVTQATVSRDIKELRLVKSLSPNGKYKYSTGRDNARDISSKFYSLFGDSVMSVEAAGNMIVVKCMTGMAQAVCASMDTLHFPDFIGTLAGEDTILIICKTDEIAEEKQNELRKLIGGV